MDFWTIISIVVGICEVLFLIILPKRWLKKFKKDSALVASIPGLCTSIGVFLSFLTIAIVLGFSDIVTKAVKDNEFGVIIKNLSTKFIFSVIGILASIIWNWKIKLKITKIDATKEVPDQVLVEVRDTLKEMRILLKEGGNNSVTLKELVFHTKAIETKLVFHTKGIETKIDTKVFPELVKISSGITEENETLHKVNTMMSNSGDELKNVLAELHSQLSENIEKMGESATKEARAFQLQFEEFLKKHMTELAKQSADEIQSLQSEIHKTLITIQETTQNNANELTEAVGTINKTLEKLQANLSEQVTDIKDNWSDNIEKTIESELKSKVKEIKNIFDEIKQSRLESETTLNTAYTEFKAALENNKKLDNTNKNVLDALNLQLNSTKELQTEIQENNKNLKSMAGGVDGITNSIQTISNMANELQKLARVIEQYQIKK